ncbi:MAG: hypothetical protein IPM69_07735 [Ignavibacteria bacterium]|nr:hypothetical protein [Ignavibacteria bacterium]
MDGFWGIDIGMSGADPDVNYLLNIYLRRILVLLIVLNIIYISSSIVDVRVVQTLQSKVLTAGVGNRLDRELNILYFGQGGSLVFFAIAFCM